MNKATTTVASVPLTWAEDDALALLSRTLRMPKAGVLRLGLLSMLKEYAPTEAVRMLRGRIQRVTMFFFVVSIPALSFAEGDEFEARRPRRAGMCARVGAHPARKPQVAA